MNNAIKIICWNARGIRNKKDELLNFLESHEIDICLLTETWLNNTIEMKFKDYYCYRCDRQNGRGGGVAICIKKTIKHEPIPPQNTTLIENVGIKLFVNNEVVNIFSCYFPGGAAGRDPSRKHLFATDLRKLTRFGKYILGGDWNCRHSYWGCRRSNTWGNILYDKLRADETQIMFPTDSTYVPADHRRQPSTLDFFLTSIPQHLTTVRVINDLGSDHLPICSSLNLQHETCDNLYYNFSIANWKRYGNSIQRNIPTVETTIISNTEQIDDMITIFTNVINTAISDSVPKCRPKPTKTPLPNYIKVLIQHRNIYRRNWKRYRDISDHRIMTSLNNEISKEIKVFRNKSWNSMLSKLDKSSPPFWKISKVLKKKCKTIPFLKDNNIVYYSNQEKTENLAQNFKLNHYISNNLSDSSTVSEVDIVANSVRSSEVNQPNSYFIDINKTTTLIKNLKNKKSPGLDGINNKCLKRLPKTGIKYFTNILNACLQLCYFPRVWKKAKTIPILKPNKPPEYSSSYRPISLISSLSKILEKILKDKLTHFVNDNDILPAQQFGFRREHNTSQPLTKIRNLVHENFKESKSTGMILLDIKSAFDSVWHNGLIYKLKRLNFPIELIKIVQSFLTDRTFRVSIGHSFSNEINLSAGCPQGSCLSPTLYNIFTADIPQLSECTMCVFADDTSILSSSINASDIQQNLTSALSQLHNYFNKWKILVNPEKTQAIYFTRKRNPCFVPQSPLRFMSHEVPWEINVKYLGVILDRRLNFKDHIPYVVDKLNKATRIMYPLINRKSDLNINNKKLIFKAIFQPIIYYCAPVWSSTANCHVKKLQIAQNKILKLILRLPWHYSTRGLHTLAGIDFVHVKIHKLTSNFKMRCQQSIYTHVNDIIST